MSTTNRNGKINRTSAVTAGQLTAFRNEVREFYREHGRSFPWRNTRDPYTVLVSEVMLQQTQTVRVIPKFEEWMRTFPSVESLAAAPRSEVLTLWNGLGYNRRAVYLQEACREVCKRFNGVFPSTEEELRTLPGIGAYTAGAVCAFAFNLPAVFIETNIRSVFIYRFFPDAEEKIDDKILLPLIAQTVDTENPREWYYALMDFGADLKAKLPNPSRNSRHYAKQSKFQGSFRQARGAVLRQLSLKKSATLADIAAAEHIEMERLTAACEKLVLEKLITRSGGNLYLQEE